MKCSKLDVCLTTTIIITTTATTTIISRHPPCCKLISFKYEVWVLRGLKLHMGGNFDWLEGGNSFVKILEKYNLIVILMDNDVFLGIHCSHHYSVVHHPSSLLMSFTIPQESRHSKLLHSGRLPPQSTYHHQHFSTLQSRANWIKDLPCVSTSQTDFQNIVCVSLLTFNVKHTIVICLW